MQTPTYKAAANDASAVYHRLGQVQRAVTASTPSSLHAMRLLAVDCALLCITLRTGLEHNLIHKSETVKSLRKQLASRLEAARCSPLLLAPRVSA